MPELALPLELLDLPDLGELTTRVVAFEEGTATIRPARAPGGVVVQVVRLHVPPEDKLAAHAASGASGITPAAATAGATLAVPSYWDCTATTLRPSLMANLPVVVAERRWLRIRKFGVAPRARFSLEVFPPGVGGPAFGGLRR